MIVFLHGLIGSAAHWRGLNRHLNHPDTWSPEIRYLGRPLQEVADEIAAGIDRRGAGAVTLVGNSIGCVLALLLEARAKSLVLAAPPFDYDNAPLRLHRDKLQGYVDALYDDRRPIDDHALHRRDALSKLSELMSTRRNLLEVRRLKRDSLSFRSDPRLARAGRKVTCVIGQSDFTTPVPDFRQFLQQHAPLAKLITVPKCGHTMPLEAPRELAEIVAQADDVQFGADV